MRIGIEIRNLLMTGMGISNLVRPLLDSLVRQSVGDRLLLIGPKGALPWDGVSHTERVDVPGWTRAGRASQVRYDWHDFTATVRSLRLDALICPYFDVRLPRGPRCLVGVYDLCMMRVSQVYPLALTAYYNTLLRWNMRLRPMVFTSSDYSKEDIVREFRLTGDRVRVIYGSLDPEFDETAPDADEQRNLAQALGLNARPFLLYTGGVERRKNIPRLLQALKLLTGRPGLRDLVLVVTGHPEHYAKLLPQVHALGLAEHFVRAGRISRRTLKQLYGIAGAVVYPSLFEGFGMPLIEAMSVGTPIASSQAACLPEIGGDYPLYFNPYDVGEMAEACGAALAAARRPVEPLPEKFTVARNARRFRDAVELLR
jgi:glycosyltransferase involved in cell wall biosynthesis